MTRWARLAAISTKKRKKDPTRAMAKRNSDDGKREARSGKRRTERDRGGFKASRHGKASAAGPKAQQKLAAEQREKHGAQHPAHDASRVRKGQRIAPRRIGGKETVAAQ